MNIAVVGAGRTVNGIGSYIAKYFHQHHMPVTAVLGSSAASSSRIAAELEQYGIQAKAFSSFKTMIARAKPYAIVIASPTPTHAFYIELCVSAGLHVFCDKPFVAADTFALSGLLVRVLRRTHGSGLTIAMNSQWPFVLPFYEALCGSVVPNTVRSFAIRLSPTVLGPDMIQDSVPHALSILYSALGNGEILDLMFTRDGEGYVIDFSYQTDQTCCAVTIALVQELYQPRTFAFGFNGRIATRVIDPATYAMSLVYQDKILAIPDPLELSVMDFIISLSGAHAPHIGPDHIVRTTMLLQQIYHAATMNELTIWKN